MESLQARIKSTRITRGLSQAELAKRAGVSQPTVANWENGSHIPRQGVLEKIGEALGVTPVWLLSGSLGEDERSAEFYLQHPVRHLPVYSWPASGSISGSTPPAGYIPYATRKENLFGLMNLADDEWSYDIFIGDPDTARLRTGEYLAIEDNQIRITDREETERLAPKAVLGRIVAKMTFYR